MRERLKQVILASWATIPTWQSAMSSTTAKRGPNLTLRRKDQCKRLRKPLMAPGRPPRTLLSTSKREKNFAASEQLAQNAEELKL